MSIRVLDHDNHRISLAPSRAELLFESSSRLNDHINSHVAIREAGDSRIGIRRRLDWSMLCDLLVFSSPQPLVPEGPKMRTGTWRLEYAMFIHCTNEYCGIIVEVAQADDEDKESAASGVERNNVAKTFRSQPPGIGSAGPGADPSPNDLCSFKASILFKWYCCTLLLVWILMSRSLLFKTATLLPAVTARVKPAPHYGVHPEGKANAS